MAALVVDGADLVVRLNPLEQLGAMRANVRIPLSSITAVRVSETPSSELRGIRAPGIGIPGVISLGTRRGRGFRDFAAVYYLKPAVLAIDATGARFDRLVVSASREEAEAQTRQDRPGEEAARLGQT